MKRIVNEIKTGENIKRLCDEKNLRITDLQKIMGFKNPQSIYKWFRGDVLPSVDHLFVLVLLFEKPLEEILIFNEKVYLIFPPERAIL